MQLKFIHLRCATEDQGLLPKGGATIGYSLADGRDEFQADVVRLHFVIAKCSPQDHFNKRLGRIICEGRMDAGRIPSWIFQGVCVETRYGSFLPSNITVTKSGIMPVSVITCFDSFP